MRFRKVARRYIHINDGINRFEMKDPYKNKQEINLQITHVLSRVETDWSAVHATYSTSYTGTTWTTLSPKDTDKETWKTRIRCPHCNEELTLSVTQKKVIFLTRDELIKSITPEFLTVARDRIVGKIERALVTMLPFLLAIIAFLFGRFYIAIGFLLLSSFMYYSNTLRSFKNTLTRKRENELPILIDGIAFRNIINKEPINIILSVRLGVGEGHYFFDNYGIANYSPPLDNSNETPFRDVIDRNYCINEYLRTQLVEEKDKFTIYKHQYNNKSALESDADKNTLELAIWRWEHNFYDAFLL